MKINSKIPLAVLLFVFASCSVVKKNSDEIAKESVLPSDREKIVQPVSSVYTSSEIAKGVLKGDWAIESVNGKPAVGETAPYIKFVPEEGKIYGNNGCNVINGNYSYNPSDSTLSFSYLTSTMRLCHKTGITDMEINLALDSTRRYECKLAGDDYLLSFYNERNDVIMELMHQNFQFLNGTWLVKEIDNEAINIPGMKLVIDIEEGKIHGNTGCNVLNGTLEINMKGANSVSFQSIAKTLRLCPDINYETQLCVALEETVRAKPLKEGKVEFIDSQNKRVLLLERTSDK